MAGVGGEKSDQIVIRHDVTLQTLSTFQTLRTHANWGMSQLVPIRSSPSDYPTNQSSEQHFGHIIREGEGVLIHLH